MSKKILISFIISLVASGFIYIVTKDDNPKQNNINGNNIGTINNYAPVEEPKKP